MARTVAIGVQDFETLRKVGAFYVDKTGFVRDWWRANDSVTLVCRPRRFGKTLALSTAECFLSTRFAGRGPELFGGLDVWDDPDMRALQGTVPVVALSFADVKERSLESALAGMKRTLRSAVEAHGYLRESASLGEGDHAFLAAVSDKMDDETAANCLKQLCSMLEKHHGVRPVVLLDEYDTPMQEAWLSGYWDGMSAFVRSLFNSTFKTNPALGRALMTGVTRVASESIFSDLNNLRVVTTTTPMYETAFGFTQGEVDAALAEFGFMGEREDVRRYYDGFTFGDVADIYNPWSITNYLKDGGRLGAHWVNTSSNGLVSSLVRRGDVGLKDDFEMLLNGESVVKRFDEHVDFRQLGFDVKAIWPLLLATGYLRVVERDFDKMAALDVFTLALTNVEVRSGFDKMVSDWFGPAGGSYNEFCRALLTGDLESANGYLNRVTRACMSSFDAANAASEAAEPERFYHGLVLGLLVELRGRYAVESNRESGFGRYDVMLVPNDGAAGADPAVVIEFKALDPGAGEDGLAAAVEAAHAQIAERSYATALAERGIAPERIREYGIAFSGKQALVG